MAKSNRGEKRSVNVDFTDVEAGTGGGFHIPEGDYGVVVHSAELTTSSNDNEQIKWVFKGTEGKAKGKQFFFYTPLVEQALWKLRGTLEALGVETPDSAMDIDLDELIGMEGIGQVVDDEYQGKTRSKLSGLSPGEEDVSDKKPAKGKNKAVKVSEDEVKEMSEDELESLVEKHSLDVDLKDYKVLRKKIVAVVAELAEKDLLEA